MNYFCVDESTGQHIGTYQFSPGGIWKTNLSLKDLEEIKSRLEIYASWGEKKIIYGK